ncbi:MAG TPA: response regulator, partial [Candidatus Acidoferrum sp.]
MNPTILLVDVASAERENWKAFLKNQNYDVLTADNAESAREMCLRLQPDLVLLHDHLPGVRGAELCRRLK